MNIDDSLVGKEMNDAIAKEVMGWSGWPDDGRWNDWYKDGLFVRPASQWNPCANIAHAWEAAEKLRLCVQPHGAGWCATRNQDGDADCREWFAYADTAPLAICRSALKAVRA